MNRAPALAALGGVLLGGAAASGVFAAVAGPIPQGEVAFEITLGDLQGPGWRAQGVALKLASPQVGRAGGQIAIDRLVLPAPFGALRRVTAHCATLDYSLVHLRCRDARIEPGPDGQGFRRVSGDIHYRLRERALSAVLTAEHASLGTLALDGRLEGKAWSVKLEAKALSLAELQALLPPPRPNADPLSVSGDTDLTLRIDGNGGAYDARFRGTARQLAASNGAGTLAGDALSLTYEGTAAPARSGDGIAFTVAVEAPAGEAYVEPIYVNLADHPGTLSAGGELTGETISLDRLSFALVDVIQGHSDGLVNLKRDPTLGRWRIEELPLAFDPMRLPGAYAVLLQPWLAGTDLDDLQTTGELAGRVRIADDQLREAHITLRALHAEDRDGRLAVYGLDGEVDRLADGRLQPRWLAFDGGFLYGIPFGAQRADFTERTAGPGWRLATPIDVPVLDGQLHLERLALTPPDTAGAPPTIALDASLTAIGMRALSHALGWPPLAGTLSGRIPSVTYEKGDIAIAGTLEAQVFQGRITADGLRIREPFGNRAIARADIQWRQLDLEELSSTFSFGRMNGRVDGHLKDLVLLNWSPLRFDGALYTSPGDRSRHRISQRAVDNIASLGGGASAALSSTFLRFFEDFAYDELRLGCRLAQGLCRMSGLEPVTDGDGRAGYLILRGRGLPRLQVVGHAERVDWPRLLAQLRSITEPDGDISVEP